MMMDVSIILVNYNTRHLTQVAIESIQKHTSNVVYEIILIDNASTDGSKEFFEKRKDIKYLYNKENIGFGRANNLGYQYAKGKYILLLNTDTYLINNAIKEFFDYMEEASKEVACVGCWLKNAELGENASEVHFLHINTVLRNSWNALIPSPLKKRKSIVNKSEEEGVIKEKKVEAVIGADMFIRREVIERYDLFDEKIFMYCEEIDVQKRWTDAGYKMMLISSPQIVHLEGQSSTRFSANRNIMFTRGVFYYLKKHNTWWKYYGFRVVYAFLKLPMIFNRNYTLRDRLMILDNVCFTRILV